MSRYIDAEELLKEICCDWTGQPLHGSRKITIANVRGAIEYEKLRADDVKPVRHGKWIKQEEPYVNTYECSNCNRWFTIEDETPEENNYNYCPNCGADMMPRPKEMIKNE